MAPTRRSRLEEAATALFALLSAIGGAIHGLAEKEKADPDSLDSDKAKANSATRVIPVPHESHAECPPGRGWLVTRRWHMSKVSREYQARVTGFPPFTEWKFWNIEFDGFHAPECRLQEAKARYDQFFNAETGEPKHFFEAFGVTRMLTQARIQSTLVESNPPAKLTWYFMQPISHKFFSQLFVGEKLFIESILHP